MDAKKEDGEFSLHIVLPSDTISGIALKYKMSVSQLKSINGMISSGIYPGQVNHHLLHLQQRMKIFASFFQYLRITHSQIFVLLQKKRLKVKKIFGQKNQNEIRIGEEVLIKAASSEMMKLMLPRLRHFLETDYFEFKKPEKKTESKTFLIILCEQI